MLSAIMANIVAMKKPRKCRCCSAAKATFLGVPTFTGGLAVGAREFKAVPEDRNRILKVTHDAGRCKRRRSDMALNYLWGSSHLTTAWHVNGRGGKIGFLRFRQRFERQANGTTWRSEPVAAGRAKWIPTVKLHQCGPIHYRRNGTL
jgi:hypothetical protein